MLGLVLICVFLPKHMDKADLKEDQADLQAQYRSVFLVEAQALAIHHYQSDQHL